MEGDLPLGRPFPSSELLDPLFFAETVMLCGCVGVSWGLAGGLNIFTPHGLLGIDMADYVYNKQGQAGQDAQDFKAVRVLLSDSHGQHRRTPKVPWRTPKDLKIPQKSPRGADTHTDKVRPG